MNIDQNLVDSYFTFNSHQMSKTVFVMCLSKSSKSKIYTNVDKNMLLNHVSADSINPMTYTFIFIL